MPKVIWEKKPAKVPLSLFYITFTAGYSAYPSMWFIYPVRLHRRKLNISFVIGCQLEIASWLVMGAVSTSPLSTGALSVFDMFRPHAFSHCLSEFICQSCCVWKAVFSWCFLSPLGPTIFLPSLLHSSLSPEGERFDGDIPIRTECSKVSLECWF